MTGLYIVIGILIAVVVLLTWVAIKPKLKKYKLVPVKPKKRRTIKKVTKKKGKYLQIRIL